MPSPYEIVAGPVGLWSAPAGTSNPLPVPTLPAVWQMVGMRGSRSISEEGIEMAFTEEIDVRRVLDSSAAHALFRKDQDLLITLGLLDISVETFASAMGEQAPQEVLPGTGTPGYMEAELLRLVSPVGEDQQVSYRSFLVRTPSPYGDNMIAQFWVPKAYASLSGPLTYTKGEAVQLDVEILAVLDETHGYGQYRAQNALPL